MDMAVDDTGHDEFPAEISDLSFILRKTGLVAHVDEFTVLHYKSGCLQVVRIRSKDFCIFNNLISFHYFSPLDICCNVFCHVILNVVVIERVGISSLSSVAKSGAPSSRLVIIYSVA